MVKGEWNYYNIPLAFGRHICGYIMQVLTNCLSQAKWTKRPGLKCSQCVTKSLVSRSTRHRVMTSYLSLSLELKLQYTYQWGISSSMNKQIWLDQHMNPLTKPNIWFWVVWPCPRSSQSARRILGKTRILLESHQSTRESESACIHVYSGAVRRKRGQLTGQDGSSKRQPAIWHFCCFVCISWLTPPFGEWRSEVSTDWENH